MRFELRKSGIHHRDARTGQELHLLRLHFSVSLYISTTYNNNKRWSESSALIGRPTQVELQVEVT